MITGPIKQTIVSVHVGISAESTSVLLMNPIDSESSDER
jgi:hypothetical protein